jgi:hypothetical protein
MTPKERPIIFTAESVDMKATQSACLYASCRRVLADIVKPGGIALSFGWNSTGMGKDWPIEELMLVCHGAAHNDTICLAQRKPESLFDASHHINTPATQEQR